MLNIRQEILFMDTYKKHKHRIFCCVFTYAVAAGCVGAGWGTHSTRSVSLSYPFPRCDLTPHMFFHPWRDLLHNSPFFYFFIFFMTLHKSATLPHLSRGLNQRKRGRHIIRLQPKVNPVRLNWTGKLAVIFRRSGRNMTRRWLGVYSRARLQPWMGTMRVAVKRRNTRQ